MMAFNNIQATRFPIFQFRLKWERAAVCPTKGTRTTLKKKNKKEAVESDLILKRKAKDEEIQKVKQKISGIESCIKSLREEVFK